MSAYQYTLPATAVCPGCGSVVVLPKEPLFPDSPPAICGTCETEVPDYRRDSYDPAQAAAAPAAPARSPQPVPLEQRRFSRGSLFRSLGGALAERGLDAVETAKDRFGT